MLQAPQRHLRPWDYLRGRPQSRPPRLHAPCRPQCQRGSQEEICAYHNAPPTILNSNVSEEEDDDYEDSDEQTDDEHGKRVRDGLWVEIDGMKSRPEKLEWIRALTIQLEEERGVIEAKGLVLEKHKFKWHKFRSNKDWDMERMRLENEKLMLENERAAMLVRQKELELGHRGRGDQ